jgi:hypothetical protein
MRISPGNYFGLLLKTLVIIPAISISRGVITAAINASIFGVLSIAALREINNLRRHLNFIRGPLQKIRKKSLSDQLLTAGQA